jgi:ribosome-binding factor A
MSQRTDRVGDQIRRELSELIQREMRDPRVSLVTVTQVEVSADFRHANVRVSALGAEDARAGALKALESARGFLRRELAQRLSLRVTPELRFFLDRGAEHSQHISSLLDRLREDGESRDS